MIAQLLQAIRDRVLLVQSLSNATVRIAPNPRFDNLVEGRLNVVVAPIAILYDFETRDVVKETTTVTVAVAEYFADKFDDADTLGLLDVVPAIEQAFIGGDIAVSGATYRFESIQALAEPSNDTMKDVPGGILDVSAADNAYIYQAPVYITYARYLRGPVRTPIILRDLDAAAAPTRIDAPDELRLRLQIYDGERNITTTLYQQGTLCFG